MSRYSTLFLPDSCGNELDQSIDHRPPVFDLTSVLLGAENYLVAVVDAVPKQLTHPALLLFGQYCHAFNGQPAHGLGTHLVHVLTSGATCAHKGKSGFFPNPVFNIASLHRCRLNSRIGEYDALGKGQEGIVLHGIT
jgi:hypothetical protein